MVKRDDAAFPRASHGTDDAQAGLTKRELFAAMAMQGLLVNLDRESPQFRLVVSDAVAMADALLAALQPPATNSEPKS